MKARGWLTDLLVGGISGGIVGAIVSVTLVILSGVAEGYEASLSDVFRYNSAVGVVALVMLIGAPLTGVILARRRRAGRR